MAINLADWTDHDNIAELLTADKLSSVGNVLCAAIRADDMSREKWLKDNDKWLKLAQQVMEEKSYPWPNASNIKYPTLSIAAIQFHAQAFPALLGQKEIVKARIIGGQGTVKPQPGMDPEQAQQIAQAIQEAREARQARAARVGRFMSLQATDLMEGWIDDMDRLLIVLPIVGLVYKKTYYSTTRNKIVSEMVSARDLILNYNSKNYERARKTHEMWLDSNEVYESTASGLFLDVDLSPANDNEVKGTRDKAVGLTMISSETPEIESKQYQIYESHCWFDLDEDGYKEPYIITVEADSQKVLRIVARWDSEDDLIYQGDTLLRIVPSEYFTAYRFLPDPESSVYALGFGRLLGPSNSAVNGIINMLMDAGHANTLGGGFIGRGARVMGGTMRMKPNEWIEVQSTGDDLRKSIVPRPTQEPSAVLFQLLGMMINAGKDLSTVQDVFMGKNPGQNQPYATTKEVISQGLKVFNGIYKRVYRSMSEEFKKVYKLNFTSLPGNDYINFLDDPDAQYPDDFSPDGMDIIPSAEPDMIAEAEKIMKANSLIGKMQAGIKLNSMEVAKRTLEAEGHENVEALLTFPPDPPSVDMLKLQLEGQKFQHQQMMDQFTAVLEKAKVEAQAMRDEANSIAVLMNANTAAKAEDRALMEARITTINTERDQTMDMAEKQMNLLIEQMKEHGKDKDREASERADARKASTAKAN
jgi:chaperonin GroES